MPGRQDEVMVVRTLAFMTARQIRGLIGLGTSADAKDVEIAILRHQLLAWADALLSPLDLVRSSAWPPSSDRESEGQWSAMWIASRLIRRA
jgi:hypothetical protein